MTVTVLMLGGGIAVLYFGAALLVQGAAEIGARAGISSIVIGLTVVSVGTSAPELAVSLLAAFRGSPDLAVGNVFGSNLANVGLILGIAALFRPLEIHGRVVRREIPWMLAVTVLALPLLWNLHMGRVEGAILVTVLVVYLLLLIPAMRQEGIELPGRAAQIAGEGRAMPVGRRRTFLRPVIRVVGGGTLLVAGGHGIVVGASGIAAALGVSELMIGLSIVAVGTSLPELATTLVAAVRNEADLAVGNIVGSNIFNLTFVLGGTALIHPIPVAPHVLAVEYPATLLLSLLLLPMAITRMNVGRVEGAVLLLGYAGAWALILR